MIEVPKLCPPFVLTGRDGSRRTFFTRMEVVRALGFGFLCEGLGEEFSPYEVNTWRDLYAQSCWREVVRSGTSHILRDARGRVLRAQDFEDLAPMSWQPWMRSWSGRLRFYSGVGPVPGTAKRKASRNMWRHPKTAQERKQGLVVDPEDALAPARPCRTGRQLPSAWDDLYPAARKVRSWKSFRKTQYKTP